MKAPDKIYIDDLAVVNNCATKISLKQLPHFSEYIRKDALLEWAKKMMNIHLKEADEKNDTFSYGVATGVAAMIDKLNSM